MNKEDASESLKHFAETIQPDRVNTDEIINAFARSVTLGNEARLLSKRPWYVALANLSVFTMIIQSMGVKVALAAFLTVAAVGGVAVVDHQRAVQQAQLSDAGKITQVQATETPSATANVEISTQADIDTVSKAVDQANDDLDKISKDLDSLDVSFSTHDLDKAMVQLEASN